MVTSDESDGTIRKKLSKKKKTNHVPSKIVVGRWSFLFEIASF